MSEQIAAAIVAALGDLTNVTKEHKGGGGGKTYTYANLPDLIDATRPKLHEHGLVALTPIHDHPEGLACTVVLLHTSGERMDFGPFAFPAGRDAQATGSWITYVRRYALLAALGMGAEDDDGQSAQAAAPRQQNAQERPAAPPLSDSQRHEIEAAIGALDQTQTERLKAEWKQRKIRKLETLTADDLDAVHALIVEIESGVPA